MLSGPLHGAYALPGAHFHHFIMTLSSVSSVSMCNGRMVCQPLCAEQIPHTAHRTMSQTNTDYRGFPNFVTSKILILIIEFGQAFFSEFGTGL